MTSLAVVIFSAVYVGVVLGGIEEQAIRGPSEFVNRIKRNTDKQNPAISGFSAQEKQNILDKHNEYRRIPNAADMLQMSWDNELEALAQGWANQCRFEHNPSRTIASSSSPIGENLHIKAPTYNEVSTVTSWYNEVSHYTYSSNACSAVCGHYTQVVWATSYKIGCGIKFCSSIQQSTITNGYVVVCNYLPAGNFIGQQPYKSGTSCSQCPADKPTCDNKLCRAGATPTTAATMSTTSGTTGFAATSPIVLVILLCVNILPIG